MKKYVLNFVLVCLWSLSGQAIQVGDTIADIEKKLGSPNGKVAMKGETGWIYPQGTVTFVDGKVTAYEWMSDFDFERKKVELAERRKAQKQASGEVRKIRATRIDIACLDLGKGTANCYVVHADNNDAYVIDPGGNASKIGEYLKRKRFNVVGYLLTHAHNDHIRAVPKLQTLIPAPVGMHRQDIPLYKKRMGNVIKFSPLFADRRTYGDDMLSFSVIHTPGHSPGSVCLYFKRAGLLFTGDTLFSTSVGRTDLDGGRDVALNASLKKLKSLPPETKVFPGHGAAGMTMESVLGSNPFMKRL